MFARVVFLFCALLHASAATAQDDAVAVDDLVVSFTDLCTALTRVPDHVRPPDLSWFGLTYGLEEENQSLYAKRVADYYATFLESPGTDTLTASEHAAVVAQNALANVTSNHRPTYPYFERTWLFASPAAVFTHSLYEDELPARAQCEAYVTGTMSQDAMEQLMVFVFGDLKTCNGPRSYKRSTLHECTWPHSARNFWVEIIRNDGRAFDANFTAPPNIKLTMMYQAPA